MLEERRKVAGGAQILTYCLAGQGAEDVGPWEMEDSGGAGMVREDSLTGLDYLERSRAPLDRETQKGGLGWKRDSGLTSTHVITKVPLNG